MIDLNEGLSSMIRAGIPIDEGLRSTARRLRKVSRKFIESLEVKIEQRANLVETIDYESEKLPIDYYSLVKSVLRMRRLPEVLRAYSSFSRSRMGLRQEIGNAVLVQAASPQVSRSLFICRS